MTNRTKIIIGIVIVIVIIVIAIICGVLKSKKVDNTEVENPVEFGNVFDYLNEIDEEENQVNDIIENNVIENNVVEENLISNTEINEVNNTTNNTVVGKEEQESSNENTEVDNKETAIELAQKEWAISVDSYDFQAELQSDGTYVVKVINKTNRNEVTRYTVNVKTGTVIEAE